MIIQDEFWVILWVYPILVLIDLPQPLYVNNFFNIENILINEKLFRKTIKISTHHHWSSVSTDTIASNADSVAEYSLPISTIGKGGPTGQENFLPGWKFYCIIWVWEKKLGPCLDTSQYSFSFLKPSNKHIVN